MDNLEKQELQQGSIINIGGDNNQVHLHFNSGEKQYGQLAEAHTRVLEKSVEVFIKQAIEEGEEKSGRQDRIDDLEETIEILQKENARLKDNKRKK